MQCFLLDTAAKRRLTLNTLSVGRREESLRLAPLREPRPKDSHVLTLPPGGQAWRCPLTCRTSGSLHPERDGGQTLRSLCKRRSPGVETPSVIDRWSAPYGLALGTQQQMRTMRPFPDLREGSLVQARTVLRGRSWHSRQVCPTSEPPFSPESHLAKARKAVRTWRDLRAGAAPAPVSQLWAPLPARLRPGPRGPAWSP